MSILHRFPLHFSAEKTLPPQPSLGPSVHREAAEFGPPFRLQPPLPAGCFKRRCGCLAGGVSGYMRKFGSR